MRRIHDLAVRTFYLIIVSALLSPVLAATIDTETAPTRGIAVLASSIGSDISPENLAEFVQQGKFSPVVIDWAWITYHWDRTDFAAVNKFLDLMAAKRVPVAAMYRPRFLSNPTVPTQMNQSGERDTDHAEICYADPSARKWGLSWGEKILDKCPSIREIIIYNPTNICRCPECIAAAKTDRYGLIVHFLAGARSAWKAEQPAVKLGVVGMTDPGFWKVALQAVDVAHPYLLIRKGIDPAKDVAGIVTVRSIVKEKMGSCLGKITWEEGAKVSVEQLKTVDSLARKNGLSYFFWTFDTVFISSLYDQKAVAQMVGIDPSAVEKLAGKKAVASDDASIQPNEAQLASAAALIEQLKQAAPGAPKFEAIKAVAKKAMGSDAAARGAIVDLLIAAVRDRSRGVYDRWPCCYVLGRIGDQRCLAELSTVLLEDESEVMRGVAAEALGQSRSQAGREAMMQAARRDTDRNVRDTIARYLGSSMPELDPNVEPIEGKAVKELAPSGPPTPPAGPAKPVDIPLPWPFPGNHKAQNVFNNYQTMPDMYVHAGLDFIHPVGTPVKAVASGYVAYIRSTPPHTHDLFIVAAEKGGNKGWCYTHMDPATYTFKEGDRIEQGQVLGKLVEFAVNGQRGADHLHLHYVTFTKGASGQVTFHSAIDPLYFFDWRDTVPPALRPLHFVADGTTRQFEADSSGTVTVSGKVDILAAISDVAYESQQALYGVPVVMFSISDGTHTVQKLALDERGPFDNETQTGPMYLSRDEGKKAFRINSLYPYYQVLRVTKSDGDGKIEPEDAKECWDTTAKNSDGKPLWPNGKYSVNIYAWDIAGNRGAAGAVVEVRN